MTFFASKEIQNIINTKEKNISLFALKNSEGVNIVFDFSELNFKKQTLTIFCHDNYSMIQDAFLNNLNYTLSFENLNIELHLKKIKLLKQKKIKLIFKILQEK